jgi:uncharacterized protein YjbI with pentapeptide repeats
MANEEHLAILLQGVDVWNVWREENPDVRPDLSQANLSRVNLSGANLNEVNLSRADLRNAYLRGALLDGANLRGALLDGANLHRVVLEGANLRGANLRGADLSGAVLSRAVLISANLRDADLDESYMTSTVLADLDLSGVHGLETVKHFGPSHMSIDTLVRSLDKIPEVFRHGCGVPESFIEYLPALLGAMEPIEFHSCFISYSTKDEAFAKRLHSNMRENNLRVWFGNADLTGGHKIFEQIDEAIRVYDKFIVVLSRESLRSKWVMNEIRRTRKAELANNQRKFFPIRLVDMKAIDTWECLDPETGTDLAAEIREYYIPDFRRWKNHDSFEREFAKLLKALKATEAPPVPRAAPSSSSVIDYERGLEHLRGMAKGNTEFATLEARLLERLQEERLHGVSENTRATKSQVIHSLNDFVSSNGLGESFTDLCRG